MSDQTTSLDVYEMAFMLSCCRMTLPFKSNVDDDTWTVQISFTNHAVPNDAKKLAEKFFKAIADCKYNDSPNDMPQSVKNYLSGVDNGQKKPTPPPASETKKEELRVEGKKPTPTKSKLSTKKQSKKSKKK